MSPKSHSNGVFLTSTLFASTYRFPCYMSDSLTGTYRFLNAELAWSAQKVDETLLPIIRKVGQRGKVWKCNQNSPRLQCFAESPLDVRRNSPEMRISRIRLKPSSTRLSARALMHLDSVQRMHQRDFKRLSPIFERNGRISMLLTMLALLRTINPRPTVKMIAKAVLQRKARKGREHLLEGEAEVADGVVRLVQVPSGKLPQKLAMQMPSLPLQPKHRGRDERSLKHRLTTTRAHLKMVWRRLVGRCLTDHWKSS